jgi:predicted DNA-binding transcriptional regulator AlpA
MTNTETAQQRFDRTYITSTEICGRIGCRRVSLMQARKRGMLPDEIHVNDGQLVVWERAAIEPWLQAWERRRKMAELVREYAV